MGLLIARVNYRIASNFRGVKKFVQLEKRWFSRVKISFSLVACLRSYVPVIHAYVKSLWRSAHENYPLYIYTVTSNVKASNYNTFSLTACTYSTNIIARCQ